MSAAASGARARSHPKAILAVWVWQAVIAAVAAWPAASLVRALVGNDARGDSPLWEPGGASLIDLLWRNAGAAAAAADGALLVLLVGATAGLLSLPLLMTVIARPPRRTSLPRAVVSSLRALPTFAKCAAVVFAAQGAVLGVGVFLGALVEGWTRSGLGEAHAQMLKVVVVLPFGAIVLALGVAHDLARSFFVVRGERLLAGLVAGVRLCWTRPGHLGWSWAWRGAASLVPVALAALIAGRAGLGLLAFLLVAAAHQGAVLSRVALRASWLARAMRAAENREGEPPSR